ncbi:SpoIID/LytB domain-containing protein [Haliangium ochraceum]|uniref:SpoIID/LytB domain protein n=1 Tax=Haliangium ochraceum (strain DSM 14365 / JCM 11303 / SMP-2) TaxID=502025 RepID=D0LGL2_HALO1|nr:SpoIID/LytB domain-containing protein [Haliangium ochraceum]ACY12758.1 SpoIID/LytB domain protein [Haliangium ochraceum DSM 14365]
MRAFRVGCCAAAFAIAFALAACSDEDPVEIERDGLDEAYCQALVTGYPLVDVESEYLPRVVQCENGNAGFEALKAQAVAARAYLYYKLDQAGEIADGPQDQVYGCGRAPSPRVHAAVRATSGEILTYRGFQVAGFYVAGAKLRPPSCTTDDKLPSRLAVEDPFGTEHYVTYNEGRSGEDIEQTTLGLVNPANRSNRGAKSQNGAACLAAKGWNYEEILRFYYGADIELVQTSGPCVVPAAERSVRPGSRGSAWIGAAAMVLALVIGWMLIATALRTRSPGGRSRRRGRARRR